MESEAALLRLEAVYIGKQVFNVDLPSPMVDRYLRANHVLLPEADRAPSSPLVRALRVAIAKGMDLEAIEFALRLRKRRNLITQKVHILSYLVETHPEFLVLYLNDRRSRARAYVTLMAHVARGIWKYARGRRLLRQLGLMDA